jgi:hypothetical protein
MDDVVIRYTVREDFITLCRKPPPVTSIAYTIEYKGKPVVIAGIIPIPKGGIAYMQMADGIDAPKKKFIRHAREVLRIIAQNYNVVYAGVGKEYPNSAKFLRLLGFEFYNYDAEGNEVVKWQTPSHGQQ